MESSDHIIDIGPEAGLNGGEIVAEGTVKEIIENEKSITGQLFIWKKIYFNSKKKKNSKKWKIYRN